MHLKVFDNVELVDAQQNSQSNMKKSSKKNDSKNDWWKGQSALSNNAGYPQKFSNFYTLFL